MSELPKALSISFRVGSGIVEHNNREYVAPNVDPERIKDNIIFQQDDLRKKYDEIFGAALNEYNQKQREKKRPDRQIFDYYEKIRKSEKTELYQEVIVQFGDKDTCGLGSENWELCKEMLTEFAADFQKRNPNLIVFNCVAHCDEMSPHLHINFIPVAHAKEKGLPLKNSMSGALREMGFTSSSKKQNEWVAWELSEQKVMEEILHRHGIVRDEKNIHRQYMKIDEFKNYQEEIKKLQAQVNELKTAADILSQKSTNEITPQDALAIKNENDLMKAEIAKRDEQIRVLYKRATAPFERFEIFSEEKLLFVEQELEKMNIPFIEESRALNVPDYALSTCKKIAASFKGARSETLRDKLRLEIDTLIYSSESVEQLYQNLEQRGCSVKRGDLPSIKLPEAKTFIRLRTLGEEYLPEQLEKRIANRNNSEKAIRNLTENAKPLAKTFYGKMEDVVVAVRTMVYRPRKVRPKEIYSFENDSEINAMARQIGTMNEFNIYSRERLYSSAEEIENGINEKIKRVNELTKTKAVKIENADEIRYYLNYRKSGNHVYDLHDDDRLKYNIGRNAAENSGITSTEQLDELLKRAEITPEYIETLKAEINADKLKLSRVADVIQTYERIIDGNYIDNLIKANNENKTEKEEKIGGQKKGGVKR